MRVFGVIKHFKTLVKIGLGLRKYGHSFLALLDACKSDKRFFHFENETFDFQQIFDISLSQSYFLYQAYGIQPQDKVVLIGNQGPTWLINFMALSGLGIKLYLINPQFKSAVIHNLIKEIEPDFVFRDASLEMNEVIEKSISLNFSKNIKTPPKDFLKQLSKNKTTLVNLSSGTLGKPTSEQRKLRLFPYINVFFELVKNLELEKDSNVLIGLPVAHGYGLASLLTAIALKKDIYLTQNQSQTFKVLQTQKVDCWISLPTQLEIFFKDSHKKMVVPKKIITGSEPISPLLVQKILGQQVQLYNLYGTTETGVISLATPSMLKQLPETIGKSIKGIRYELRNPKEGLFELWINAPWKADREETYIFTGDYIQIEKGLWIHKGRADHKFLRNGYLISIFEIQDLLNQEFPELEPKVTWEENLLTFSLQLPPNRDKEWLDNQLKLKLPKHFLADSIALNFLK